jgi:hypothetical protein
MRAALIVLSLVGIGGIALAQVQPPAPSGAAPAPQVQATAGTPAAKAATKKAKRRARAERAAAKPAQSKANADALSSCIDLWEPATHMTRRQWTHACRRVAERLNEVALR